MQITDLKTRLIGYKKSDVCEYIAFLNQAFSEKLIDIESANNKRCEMLTSEIDKLGLQALSFETTFNIVKEENEKLKKENQRMQQELVSAIEERDKIRTELNGILAEKESSDKTAIDCIDITKTKEDKNNKLKETSTEKVNFKADSSDNKNDPVISSSKQVEDKKKDKNKKKDKKKKEKAL